MLFYIDVYVYNYVHVHVYIIFCRCAILCSVCCRTKDDRFSPTDHRRFIPPTWEEIIIRLKNAFVGLFSRILVASVLIRKLQKRNI